MRTAPLRPLGKTDAGLRPSPIVAYVSGEIL